MTKQSRINIEKLISGDPNYVTSRKAAIISELDNLRQQRSSFPVLSDIDKRDETSNFQNHLELSQQINELEMEQDDLNAI